MIDLRAAGFKNNSSVEVTSDIPVVVGQWMAFATPKDISTPVGVPMAGTQSVPLAVVGPAVAADEQLDTGRSGAAGPGPGGQRPRRRRAPVPPSTTAAGG